MCGVTGIYNFSQKRVQKEQLEKMMNCLEHRGPDDSGYFIDDSVGLGHKRLSIIDLSLKARQPISNEDNSIYIVCNGEIYNYPELSGMLQARGHRFYSKSDTEVILHLYEDFGEECLKYLNGMFAFGIWDKKRKRLFLARDRLGIKPLYYYSDNERLAFASELKSLIALDGFKKNINLCSLIDYFTLSYIPCDKSIFEGVQQLQAGAYLICENNKINVKKYWDLVSQEKILDDEDSIAYELSKRIREAVKRQMLSDVPFGAFLSGGLDSSMIVSYMSELSSKPVKTFCIGFQEKSYDESIYARRVAKLYNIEHHELICNPKDHINLLPRLPFYADSLFADPSLLPTYLVSRLARQKVTVVLSGDGGDELFAGYPTYIADRLLNIYKRVPSPIKKLIIEKIILQSRPSSKKLNFHYKATKFIEGAGFSPEKAHYWWRTVFNDSEREKLLKAEVLEQARHDSFCHFDNYFQNKSGQEMLDKFLYVDRKTWLVDSVLVKVDRMSMANSLETRVPLLDHELVEFVARIPSRLKLRGFRSKYILKKAVKDRLPKEIINRKKSGFLPSLSGWINQEWKDLADETLSKKRVENTNFINYHYVEQILKEHRQARRDHCYKIWNLMMFVWWHELFCQTDNLKA